MPRQQEQHSLSNRRKLATFKLSNPVFILLTLACGASIYFSPSSRRHQGATSIESVRVQQQIQQHKKQQQKQQPEATDKSHCISWDSDFPSLLERHNQVYLFMAAKAAGSSLNTFVTDCVGKAHERGNFINTPLFFDQTLTQQLQPPPLISNHLLETNQPLLDLIQYGSRQSLMIYVYREETERLASAIQYVFHNRMCKDDAWAYKKAFGSLSRQALGVTVNDTHCVANEGPFLEHTVQKRVQEIQFSTAAHVNCALWDEMEQSGPTILFLHYQQVDTLQKQLATRFCPALAQTTPDRTNVGEENAKDKFFGVRLKMSNANTNNQIVVPLEDWMKAKLPTMEYFTKLSPGSCKRKLRRMEDELMACPDRLLKFDAHNAAVL